MYGLKPVPFKTARARFPLRLGQDAAAGALVADVTANGPAAKAGIRNGDVITAFDGKKITDPRSLSRIAADTQIGKTVSVDLLRKGKKITVRLTVVRLSEGGARPPAAAPAKPKTKLSQLGLSLSSGVQGVVVTAVIPDSPAAEKNFQAGDVIVSVQDQPVRTPADFQQRIDRDAKAGNKVEILLVNRAGALTFVALRLG